MTAHRRNPLDRLLDDVTVQFASLRLVEEIDKSILHMDAEAPQTSIETLFLRHMRRFSQIHHLKTPLLCYVKLGARWGLLQSTGGRSQYPKTIAMPAELDEQLSARNAKSADVQILSDGEHDSLFKRFHPAKTMLLYPMFSEFNRVVCVFLVTDIDPKQTSRLSDPAFESSLKAFVFQLSIAYNYYERALQHARLRRLWTTFSHADLSPAKCFTDLAKSVRDFLPSFGPMKFRGRLEVQILMLSGPDDERELVIRGTTGKEPAGTRIALGRSFTGQLLLDKRAKSLRADPTTDEYREYFKNYLGQGKTIHTELAVRLVHNHEDVGVLNLESRETDAFNDNHVDAMERLADTIAEILAAFEARLAVNSETQLSITSSTAAFLDAITGVYRHDILMPLATVSSAIENRSQAVQKMASTIASVEQSDAKRGAKEIKAILRAIAGDIGQTAKTFNQLLTLTRLLSGYSDDFLKDISGFSKIGPTELRATVDAAVKLAKGQIPNENPDIHIDVVADETRPGTTVYCSALLKQHIYSLLKNAILSVVERQVTRPGKGEINVSITKFVPPEGEKELNEAWAVSIWDNGVGLKPSDRERLEEFEHGVRFRKDEGTGSGLPAAQKFIASFGGRLIIKSELGRSFEVVFYLNEQQRKLALRPRRPSNVEFYFDNEKRPKLARRFKGTSNGHSA